jgi:hypothetical protein
MAHEPPVAIFITKPTTIKKWEFVCPFVCPKKKPPTIYTCKWLFFSLLARIRTWDPLIKSQLLYQLSYEEFSGCKDTNFFKKGYEEDEIILGTFVFGMPDK